MHELDCQTCVSSATHGSLHGSDAGHARANAASDRSLVASAATQLQRWKDVAVGNATDKAYGPKQRDYMVCYSSSGNLLRESAVPWMLCLLRC